MPAPRWMTAVLLVAGAYNLVWGAAVVLFPTATFGLSGLEKPGVPLDYAQLWQCVGMIVGVYGVGYAVAARDPARHWPIVLVGLLGKVFGPLGYVWGVINGTTPVGLIQTIVLNDLIWWVPFALILRHAARSAPAPGVGNP